MANEHAVEVDGVREISLDDDSVLEVMSCGWGKGAESEADETAVPISPRARERISCSAVTAVSESPSAMRDALSCSDHEEATGEAGRISGPVGETGVSVTVEAASSELCIELCREAAIGVADDDAGDDSLAVE